MLWKFSEINAHWVKPRSLMRLSAVLLLGAMCLSRCQNESSVNLKAAATVQQAALFESDAREVVSTQLGGCRSNEDCVDANVEECALSYCSAARKCVNRVADRYAICGGQCCSPPPQNGKAICSRVRGCDIQCEAGYRREGNRCVAPWQSQSSGTDVRLTGVWGSSATDVYVVGWGGTILHSTGDGVWTRQNSGITQDLTAIWGSSAHDIYAVGASATILHSTGDGVWVKQDSGVTPAVSWADRRLKSVGGSDKSHVYVGGLFGTLLSSSGDGVWHTAAIDQFPDCSGACNFNGSVERIQAVAGGAYAVSTGGGLFGGYLLSQRADLSWSVQSTVSTNDPANLYKRINPYALWLFDAQHLIIAGQNAAIASTEDGRNWRLEQADHLNSLSYSLNGLWGASSHQIYAVGGYGLSSFPNPKSGHLVVLHSSGMGDWQEEVATVQESTLFDVWGSGEKDVYAVGSQGVIIHRQ